MTTQDQVTSPEPSKKLKELSVKQESLFYWNKNANLISSFNWGDVDREDWEIIKGDLISAFTVAELGEMLPRRIKTIKLKSKTKGEIWVCDNWRRKKQERTSFNAKTEADAKAKMLIYLIEHNLMKL